jgi:hypothetical protein
MRRASDLGLADRPCPMTFLVPVAFVSGLLWVCAMLLRLIPS